MRETLGRGVGPVRSRKGIVDVDIAKFGQLYIQKGRYNGKQLVPEAWVEAATSMQTSNGSNPTSDWDQGYGYQFWRCRHNAFRGDGAFGQFCVVMPDQDTVVAINSGVKDLPAVLNLVWDRLLPALEPSPLAANPAAESALKAKLTSLKIPTVSGSPSNEIAKQVTGKKFAFASNPLKVESVALQSDPSGGETTMLLRLDGKDQKIACGPGTWVKGRAALGPLVDQPAFASGAWTGEDTFSAKICFVETPFLATIKLKFDGEEVSMDTESNVGFGATKQPTLKGKAE